MDETVLEPTREGLLEEIQKCREDLFSSLLGYSVLIGVVVFFDYEEALFFLSFVSGGRAAETSVLGRVLYACLPLAMALYGKKARFPGNLIAVYAVVEGLQYVFLGFGVVFVLHLLGGGFDAFISLLMSCTLFGVPLFLLYRVWRMARRLSAVQRALGGTGSSNKWMVFLALACYLAPAYIPTMEGVRLQRLILDTQEVTRYELGAYITYMAGSPDGSLLALGTEKGLYVWDTTSRECVWSDDCLAVQRVRFSPSGRYLAAAGRGRPEGASDLAVYEVEGFRRLPGFEWPEHEEYKEKVFHDMVFRPDEETLLVLWHRTWVWYRIGWSSDGARAVQTREKELGHDTDEAELFCSEIDISEASIEISRAIRQKLSRTYDLPSDGCAYFSSDASRFIYPTYQDDGTFSFKWVHLVDTATWKEQVFQLDGYRLDVLFLKRYYEWKLNRNGIKAYFLCRKKTSGESEEVLIALDLETREKREWSIKGKRLVFSPSEEQVAILNWDVDKTIMLARLNFVNVETETETQVLRKFIKKDWGSPERLVWLKANLLVLSTEYTLGSFVFIDLKEGELK